MDLRHDRERASGLSLSNQVRSIALLDAHGDQAYSIADVATECGLSRGHFSAAFKATTGRTPYQWLMARRVDKAKWLLKGENSIAAIAAECGFSDQAHLTRVFLATVGFTPGKWRARYRHL